MANVLRIIFVQIMLCSFSVSAPLSTKKIVESLEKKNCNFPPANLYIGHGTGHSLVNCTKENIAEKETKAIGLDLCHIFWESLNNDTCDFKGHLDFKETSDSVVQQYCSKTLKNVFDEAGSKLNCTTLCTKNRFAKELCTLIHFATNITLGKKAEKVLSSTKQTQLSTTTTKPNKNTTPTKLNGDATATKLNEDATATKLNEDATTTKPNEDATTTKPNEDATTTKPIEDATTTKPNEDATTTKPNEDATTAKPNTIIAKLNNTNTTKPNKNATTIKPNENTTTIKLNTTIAKLNNTNTTKPNKNTTTIKLNTTTAKLNNTTTSKTIPSTAKTTTLNQENIESVQQEHRGPEQPENEGSEQQQNNPSEQQENNGSEQQQNNPSEQQENNGSEQQNQGSKQQGGRRTEYKDPSPEPESEGHFMAYFLTAVVLCVAGYVIFHNKQKIVAFIVEGRTGRRSSRRSNKGGYSKLKPSVDDVMPSLEKSTKSTTYVY